MISMGRAHLIKGVRVPLNLTQGHVLTYLKRFPIDKKKKPLQSANTNAGDQLWGIHWDIENAGTRIHLCEESISQWYLNPLTSALSPVSADSAASLCPVPGAATSDLAQVAEYTGARACQPFDQDCWDPWSESQSWGSAAITTGKLTFHFELLQIALVS